LTIVWVAYLVVFGGTILRRSEPHIYVANWFYLSFILTIAMLHIVNNLSMPVSWLGSKSHSARSEEHTSELQSLMRIPYAVFSMKKKIITTNQTTLSH